MERERIAREKEEEEKKLKEQKIKEEFGDTNSQWQSDKQQLQDLASRQREDDASSKKQSTAAKAAGAGQKGNQIAVWGNGLYIKVSRRCLCCAFA